MTREKPAIALVSDGKDSFNQRLQLLLGPQDFALRDVTPGRGLLKGLDQAQAKLTIVAPTTSSTWNGVSTVARIRGHSPDLPMILANTQSSVDQVIAAFRAGVTDYVKFPCSDDELMASIRRSLVPIPAMVWRRSRPRIQEVSIDRYLVGQSSVMCEIKQYLRRAALTNSNVLITGDTGTGKEKVAQLIHQESLRQAKCLVCINCAAVPESLLESELFGYERGAFTGANSSYEGKLKLAEGGTVFFDEIGDMSPLAQTKILRAIESKEVYRLGGRKGVSLDFRVVAATNHDVEAMIGEGSFRKDLYYRLNVARIHLPPLRERKEDIPLLIEYQLQELNTRCGTEVKGPDDEAMTALIRHDWPGNVRELRNVIEAAFINRPTTRIRLNDFPDAFRSLVVEPDSQPGGAEKERDALLTALLSTDWNKSKAAKKLNWSRMTVYRKMHKYHIEDKATI